MNYKVFVAMLLFAITFFPFACANSAHAQTGVSPTLLWSYTLPTYIFQGNHACPINATQAFGSPVVADGVVCIVAPYGFPEGPDIGIYAFNARRVPNSGTIQE